MSRKSFDLQVRKTAASDGALLRYLALTVPAMPAIEILGGRTNPEIISRLRRLTETRLLPNSGEFDGAFAFIPEPGEEEAFPADDGELRLADPAARIRYWLEKVRDEGGLPPPPGNAPPGGKGASLRSRAAEFMGRVLSEGRGFLAGETGGRTAIFPINPKMTLLSTHYRSGRATVNSHFFLMELAELPTPWDAMGEPFGLLLQNGETVCPPLYRREALTWSAESGGCVENIGIRDFELILGNLPYRHGENAEFFTRPEHAVTPPGNGTDVAVVGRRTMASSPAGAPPR